MQDLYQTTENYYKEQGHLARWDLMQPKSLVSFWRGRQSWPLAPPWAALCTEQLLVQINCLIPASLPATLPSLPCPPRAPLFFLVIQTHHQSPLPIPKLLMPASLKCSTPGSLIHQLRNSLAWCSPNRSKQIKTSQTRELWTAAITKGGWGNPQKQLHITSPGASSDLPLPKVKCFELSPAATAKMQNCL